uniref:Uncharacterized protein n=1 Tax=mine drainage metagenome TaxID=410659 RepID=E6PVX2_9ZZZZ
MNRSDRDKPNLYGVPDFNSPL